jgi:hypothetical protein
MSGLDENTPVELRATESSVDALARSEREAAPVTLEARLFMATRGLLPRHDAVVVVKRSVWVTRMRVAAAVALAGGLGAVWLAASGGHGKGSLEIASLEADVNFVLAMKSLGDDGTGDGIDALYLDADSLSRSIKTPASIPDDGSI